MRALAAWFFPLSLTASAAAGPVGLFRTSSVVVAYYWSELGLRQVRQRREELEAAKRAGDRRKAAEPEQWGRHAQRLAHPHLAGKAPVQNICEALQPFLAEVASRAGVERMVLSAPPGAETVDVTPHLPDALQADAATRKIVKQLRRRESKSPGRF